MFPIEKLAEKTKLELKLSGPGLIAISNSGTRIRYSFGQIRHQLSWPGALRAKEKNVRATFVPARALIAKALAALVLAAPAAAQTGVDSNRPPAASGTSSSSELTARFVASAIPTTNFIAAASRMASGDSRNDKIRKFAEALAKDQTAVANSLDAWVNVNGPVVTLRSPYTGKIGPGAAKLSAPQLLPPQRSNLRRLAASQGHDFDSLYVSTLTEALGRCCRKIRFFAYRYGLSIEMHRQLLLKRS
jgi:predicted outer membrane protein